MVPFPVECSEGLAAARSAACEEPARWQTMFQRGKLHRPKSWKNRQFVDEKLLAERPMLEQVVSQVAQGMVGWLAAGTLAGARIVVQIRFTCEDFSLHLFSCGRGPVASWWQPNPLPRCTHWRFLRFDECEFVFLIFSPARPSPVRLCLSEARHLSSSPLCHSSLNGEFGSQQSLH